MIAKEKLEKYALNLMFEMSDEQYDTLQNEFDIILKQMDLIDKIENIKSVEPMIFPFLSYTADLREDEVIENLSVSEALQNTKHDLKDQVKVPKVVE